MAGEIFVNISSLDGLAGQLDSAYDQLSGILNSLAQIKASITAVWEDEAFVAFLPRYEEHIDRLEGFKVSIDAMASLLRFACTEYENTDRDILSKL